MNAKPIYVELATRVTAMANCLKAGNDHWYGSHAIVIDEVVKTGPGGSGIDNGIKFDHDKSKTDRLVLTFGFHHMDEHGGYDGWTDHELIVTPSLQFGFLMRITGRNRNYVKEYLYDLFTNWLSANIDITYERPDDKANDYPTARIPDSGPFIAGDTS